MTLRFSSRFALAVLAYLATTALVQAGQAPLHVAGGPVVQRGAHLARMADCMGCHTYKEDKPYAGNKPMESPFGTFYTSNITQDKETGIGSWSYADFKQALHHGKRKNGNYIYPAMPFVSYTKITDDDVKALWAYFKQIKPIHNPVRDPDLIVIGGTLSSVARAGLLGWRIPFFDAGRFESNRKRSREYNEGAYYVQALGHCSSCHTPRNIAYAQEDDKFLNGFTLNGWYAPKISPGRNSSISKWSVKDLTTFLKTGELGNHTVAVGPMEEVWHDSLRHLPRADLHAIAVYIKNMPANNKTLAAKAIQTSGHQASLGASVYQQHCQTCHRSNGLGNYGVGPALDRNNLVTADKANSVVMAILEGFDPKNVWGAMPSFAKELNDQEVAAVSNYVRTAWHNRAPADTDEDMVASSRPMAAKEIPPGGQRKAVICPSLTAKVIRPALKPGDKAMLASYSNQSQLQRIVSSYRSARPAAPKGDAIKALTSAYCRALVKQPSTSETQRNSRIFQYSQKVADIVGGNG